MKFSLKLLSSSKKANICRDLQQSNVCCWYPKKNFFFAGILILNKQMLPRKIWLPHEILNTELVNMEKMREVPATSWSVIYIYRLLPRIFLNPFQAKVQFLHPLKTLKNFYDVFRGYRNLMLAWNGLNAWNPCVAVEKWPTLRFDQL